MATPFEHFAINIEERQARRIVRLHFRLDCASDPANPLKDGNKVKVQGVREAGVR
jgi:hypothetical protein